jgi:hypothetical protein
MAQLIQLKRSDSAKKVPLVTDLSSGELAINTADGKIYFKSGSVNESANIIEVITAYSEISQSVYLAISSSENVGVGTTTPISKLHVDGDIYTTTNITASGDISSSGTVFGSTGSFDFIDITSFANLYSTTHVTASGNISASGILTGEGLVITDDAEITDNLTIGGTISNVNTTHITASGNISSSAGNVYALEFHGDGSNLTNVPAGTSTTHLSASLDIKAAGYMSASNLISSGHITASGNISSSGTLMANSLDIAGNLSFASISSSGDIKAAGYVSASNLISSGHITASANISSSATITANAFVGDGSGLTNLPGVTSFTHISASLDIKAAGYVSASRLISSGEITASSHISTSATVYAEHFYSSDDAEIADNLTVGSISASLDIKTAGYVSASNLISSGHITASSNISTSANLISAELYTDVIRRQTDSSTTTKIKLDDEKIKFFANDANNQTVQIDQSVLTVTGNITSSTNISASGDIIGANISASGTITSPSYKGVPIILGRQSQVIVNPVANDFYYGNATQGFFHHNHSGKLNVDSPVGEQLGQGNQHNGIIIPFNVKDVELRASCRPNVENIGFAFWVMKNTRAAAPSHANVAAVFMGSASVAGASVGTSHEAKFWNCDLTGSHTYRTNMTASEGEALWVLLQVYDTTPGGSTTHSGANLKFYWTLSARTDE